MRPFTHMPSHRLWWGVRTYATGAAVRVRFAPSPTGFLHVGGLRTALLNYLCAKQSGGQFILRMEDTDQTRLVPGAMRALQESLRWAGIHYDEGPDMGGPYGPYVQSERLPLYTSYADKLIRCGRAYRDFRPPVSRDMSARASAILREAYLPPSESEAQERIQRGETFVVRLKMDPERTFSYEDVVYGPMSFRPDAMGGVTDDPIIIKSDGWPTYHLASVVDDTEMRITHVLRGEEWIPSMPKHLALYEALGAKPPIFVHLPLLINADGTKLSKRSGDVRVADYMEQGWEPETLVNLVALTGYSYANLEHADHDVKTMNELIRDFELTRISHTRATLPMDKLVFLNKHHLANKLALATTCEQTKQDLLSRIRPIITSWYGDHSDDYILRVVTLGQQRVDTLRQVPERMAYLFTEPRWDTDTCRAFRASVPTPSFRQVVQAGHDLVLQTRDIHADWGVWIKSLQVAGGKSAVQKSLRIALTGERAGPPLADIIDMLGPQKAAARLAAALAWDKQHH